MSKEAFIAQVRGQLIVSCQALPDEPLHGAAIMARMAIAAQMGGAKGIRANGVEDIRAIRQAVNLPIIGLYKDGAEGVYITPTVWHAQAVMAAGAQVVAFDATRRPRPNNERVADIIAAIHAQGRLALADVATLEEAQAAQADGADFVAPTLNGYTEETADSATPDFSLIRAMVAELRVPVIAEGRINTPQQARQAIACGALAVVVGSAITRPQIITANFVRHLQS
ncbi:MAG: N-acetylmannosamine-6-phosphate 2-epimerase [Candidatus Thermofonsia Clade 1 bacterium]|uniref:Putative N-acetylmannosamine-6-phosphate 2-epimerase n=1 Tax=Candidatus Thermofonsia Clade 1 bacterium TaxID=2364210 RepID=A0A2M8PFB3_9CHLR|nr:MAG: N-acetylmannosamine-6-phosphate 2-epimerase [Candidatus Thermofonsia Clade 1 bacterium]